MNKQEKLIEATIIALHDKLNEEGSVDNKKQKRINESFTYTVNRKYSEENPHQQSWQDPYGGIKTLFNDSGLKDPMMEASDKLIDELKKYDISFDHAELVYGSDKLFEFFLFFKTQESAYIAKGLNNAVAVVGQISGNKNIKIKFLFSLPRENINIRCDSEPSKELIDTIVDYFSRLKESGGELAISDTLDKTSRYWFKYIAEAVIQNSSKKKEYANAKNKSKYIDELYNSNFKDTLIKKITELGKTL